MNLHGHCVEMRVPCFCEAEVMAWDFVMNFARDNQLQVAEVCVLPGVLPNVLSSVPPTRKQ